MGSDCRPALQLILLALFLPPLKIRGQWAISCHLAFEEKIIFSVIMSYGNCPRSLKLLSHSRWDLLDHLKNKSVQKPQYRKSHIVQSHSFKTRRSAAFLLLVLTNEACYRSVIDVILILILSPRQVSNSFHPLGCSGWI